MYASEAAISPRTTFWTALVIAILALGFAFVTGYWLLYRLSYAMLLLIAVGYVWTRISLRGLSVEVNRHTDRIQAGDSIAEELTVTNTSAWPKLWLELEDPTELPGHHARFVL